MHLFFIKLSIKRMIPQQFSVGSHACDTTLFQHHTFLRGQHGPQAMGHREYGGMEKLSVDKGQDCPFRLLVQR